MGTRGQSKDVSSPSSIARGSSWYMGQSLFTMAAGAAVTAVAARIYGPEILGQFNFALAFVALFTSVATLGIEPLVVKHLIQRERDDGEILATALALRAGGGVIVSVLCVLTVWVINGEETIVVLTAIMSAALAMRACEVYLYWLRSRVELRLASIYRVLSYGALAVARVAAVLSGAPIEIYALFYLLDIVLYSALLYLAFRQVSPSKPKMRISREYGTMLLRSSWYLIVTGIATMAYNRVDQVMLGSIIPDRTAVGLYAAAATIGEMWYFIPMALVTTMQPALFSFTRNGRSAGPGSDLFLLVGIASVLLGLFTLVCADVVLGVLYGSQFLGAKTALQILSVSSIFAMVAVCQNSMYIVWNVHKFSAIFTLAGAAVNICLNVFLIPIHGIVGAAYATLATQLCVCLVLPLFFKGTRPIFGVMVQAVNPHRVIQLFVVLWFNLGGRTKGRSHNGET